MSKITLFDAQQMDPLPPPSEIKQQQPISSEQLQFIAQARQHVTNILSGADQRLLLIVGPCSIHDSEAALEFAGKLRKLADEVSDTFYIVMRAYFEKPRTTLGWKGLVYDPDLNGTNDIASGIRHSRHLLLKLAEMGLPAATEFLDPAVPRYIGDLITWACIGARTAESQIHRQFASGLPMPIAFKNNTSGNIDVAVRGVIAASSPHSFFGINDDGRLSIVHSRGNPYAHIALRGGKERPNFNEESVAYAQQQLAKHHLLKSIVIDCSHDNSSGCHENQKEVFDSIIHQTLAGNTSIRGLALESHLNAGSQQFSSDHTRLRYAVSLTDPCLDWNSTELLITNGAAAIRNGSTARVLASASKDA